MNPHESRDCVQQQLFQLKQTFITLLNKLSGPAKVVITVTSYVKSYLQWLF